jgi:SAM-dependent methyltransferase
VRDGETFARGHLAGSGHLPRRELLERRAELPPRGTGILVVAGSAAEAAEAAAALEAMCYDGVAFLDAPLTEVPGGLADLRPAARLWRPARFLEEALPRVLAALPPGREPTALDVASGAGRDAVFLAGHGFAVEARDHAPEALERAQALACRQGVALSTVACDLERAGLPPPERPFDLVICFRFLHRPLFPWMEAAVAPGGWLIYETYRDGQERFGRPRRAHFLLRPGELAVAFPALETVGYEEPDPPEGPVTARLLARRPSG